MSDTGLENKLRKGQPLFDGRRRERNLQVNGTIINIDFDLEEVNVLFEADTYHKLPQVETYEFDILYGNWTDKFGGGWWIRESD